MNLLNSMMIGLKDVWAHKLRSLLTMLGVVIGFQRPGRRGGAGPYHTLRRKRGGHARSCQLRPRRCQSGASAGQGCVCRSILV